MTMAGMRLDVGSLERDETEPGPALGPSSTTSEVKPSEIRATTRNIDLHTLARRDHRRVFTGNPPAP
jgi:hypothetical protein